MFCPKCGAQNPDGSPFCASCGAQLNAQQPQQPGNQGGFGQPSGGSSNGFKFDPQELVGEFKKNIGDFKSFGIPQYIVLGGAVLLIISIFLPFISGSFLGVTISASLLKGGFLHWLLAIIIALCSGFIAVTKKGMFMLIQGGIALLYAIFEGVFQKEVLYSLAAGFYVMLIAGIAICAGGVMQFLQDKKNG